MNKITPRLLKGFRDFDPKTQKTRLFCIESLQKVFALHGFLPIDTPILEYEDILLGKGGGETDKQVYRFEDNGKRKVVMRFDLTVPFARYVEMNRHNLPFPFYRSQIGKVFRGENTQKGRYREFVQCDFDIIGLDYASLDFTILQTIMASFRALSLPKIKVHISHRGLLGELLAARTPIKAVTKDQALVETLRIIDKIRKIGQDSTCALLRDLWDEATVMQIIQFGTKEETNDLTMTKLAGLLGFTKPDTAAGNNLACSESYVRLQEIISMAEVLGIADSVLVDPSITRGLDYYTGFVCETFVEGYEEIGSVCSGGRYNDLTKMFNDEPAPGVGASIGLDRLLSILEDAATKSNAAIIPKIVIFPQTRDTIGYCHKLVAELQQDNNSVQVYPMADKLKPFFKYVEKIEADFVCIIGTEELESGTLTIKNQHTREQLQKASVQEVLNWLKKVRSEH